MALRYLAGGRVEGLSGDTKPTTSQSGSVFYETDTNKTYDLISGTWTERSINLYRSGANQGTIDTTATDDLYTVGHVDVNGTGTLDVQSGGVIHVGADPLPAVDTLISDVDSLTSDVALKASIASPTFTGTVVLPNVPAIVTTQLDLKAPLNSPTLTTPALGTPSAGVLTNCTGLVATTGLTATGTKSSGTFLRGDDTWGAVTTYSAPTIGSTSIASGATVTTIAGLTLTSPTLTTPALGTPASGVLTNCTGLPLAGLATSAKTEALIFAVSDETSDIETGTSKGVFRMPYGFTLTGVRASVTTAPVGSTIIVDINESGTTILSTELTIDASEKTSTTAASAAVISDSALADDSEITIDIDQVGSSTAGAGLKIYLIGYQS